MASTTLITFMLQAPTTVFSVEILGSWDNFSKPYQLKRDRKTGPGQWRGCHTFQNITCDGDTLNISTSRDGGLKMGGTYWYYYVLDGDIEYHDPAEPSTNLCPLLPGQMVNVLDVPVQGEVFFARSRGDSSSSVDSAVFTLDPKDKYLSPGVRRSTTTSAVHSRKARLAPKTRPMTRAQRHSSIRAEAGRRTSRTTEAHFTLERQRSLLSVFHRMRQTRSAGSNANSSLVGPRKIFSRAGQPTKQGTLDPLLGTPKLLDHGVDLPPSKICSGLGMSIGLPSTAVRTERAPSAFMVNITGSKHEVRPLEQLASSDHSQLSIRSERIEDGLHLVADTDEPLATSAKLLPEKKIAVVNAVPSTETFGSFELDLNSPKYGYAESLASYATSANFSPCLASNTTPGGPISPCHLSQPETPVMSDFGDEFLPPVRDSESPAQMHRSSGSDLDLLLARPSSRAVSPHLKRPQGGPTPKSHAVVGGFQGYGLPDQDQASVHTIRKLPSISLKKADGASPPTHQASKQDLVHSWNDGSEDRVTALGELVDDLGYLGEMII
ncbi:hypothetical protein BDR22DRAFT_689619 [Usnea florida]